MSDKEIQKIFEDNFTKIYRRFYFRTLSREIAEDLTSETFEIFVSAAKSDKSINDGNAYLYGIASNVFKRWLQNKYDKPYEETYNDEIRSIVEHEDLEGEDEIDKVTLEEFSIVYIDKLPEKQKLILRLRLLEKENLTRICEIIGKDMNYVKTTQKRGIKNLKKLLECTPWTTQ